MSISPDEITLTPEQRQHLALLAEKLGKPWDAVLEEALSTIEHRVPSDTDNGETVLEAMTRLGLLGSVKDAPPDLSTNPKYMEGFGERER